MNSVGKVM